MSPLRSRFFRILRGMMAAFVAALVVFTPLSPLQISQRLAPVQPAQANVAGDIGACIGGMWNGTLALGEAQAKALELATVMADPTYLSCMGKAAGGDVVTIAVMVAMTALWATDTVNFDSPEGCVQALKDEILSKLAGALDSAIFETNPDGSQGLTFAGEILEALIGQTGVNLIQQVAHNAAQELIDQLWTALSPITSYLDCGCAASGTIAKAADLAQEIAGLLGDAVGEAKKCLDLLTDIGEFAEDLFNGAQEVLSSVANVVCDGVSATGIDACGLMEDAWETGKELASTLTGWMSDGLEAVGCFIFGCDDPPPPPIPPDCSTDPNKPDGASVACVCPAGMGFNILTKAVQDVDYSTFIAGGYGTKTTYQQLKYCSVCAAKGAIQTADGMCQACPRGILPGPDNKCSVPVQCAANEALDHTGHSCFSCPAGMHISADRKKCDLDPPVCPPASGKVLMPSGMNTSQQQALKSKVGDSYMSYAGSAQACVCPAGKHENASGVCVAEMQCPEWARPNYATGQCEAECKDPRTFWAIHGEFPKCYSCPEGQVSYNNVCVPQCGKGEFRFGYPPGSPTKVTATSCMACPAGTEPGGATNAQGERTACVNSCAPGTNWQALELPEMKGLKPTGKLIKGAACLACPANTYSKTERVADVFGSFVSLDVTSCEPCPAFTYSDPGSSSCRAPSANGAISVPDKPIGKANIPRIPSDPSPPEKLSPPKLPPSRERAEPPRPGPRTCDPGKVWDGRRCTIDLGNGEIDLAPRGSGSGAPGSPGRGGRTDGAGGGAAPYRPGGKP